MVLLVLISISIGAALALTRRAPARVALPLRITKR
jgi:hypothetical protein